MNSLWLHLLFSLTLGLSNSYADTVQIELNNYPFNGTFQSTLSAQAFFFDVESFDESGEESELVINPEGTPLPYKTWIQEKPSTLVIILPGFGSHYRSTVNLRLAKMLYKAGHSVLSTSNVFNFEFMTSALTSALPGYTPDDTRDLHRVLNKMIAQERSLHEKNITKIYVTGYSHGALHALFLAALEERLSANEKLGVHKFVALNPPVDPSYSLEYLDSCYDIYRNWSDDERKNYYLNSILNINSSNESRSAEAQTKFLKKVPEDQAQVALGSLFRTSLRDTLWVGHSLGRLNRLINEGPLGDLNIPASNYNRQSFYNVVEKNFNFKRYINDVVIAEQLGKNPETTPEALRFNSGLASIENVLRSSSLIKVFHNSDDTLMHTPEMLIWLKSVLHGRLTVFDRGGHLGNLYMPQFKAAYLGEFNE